MKKGDYKVLQDYFGKTSFIEFCKEKILQSVEEIAGKEVKKKITHSGLDKLHKHFSVDYIPFLQFSLEEKLRGKLIKSIFNVGKNNLKYNNVNHKNK